MARRRSKRQVRLRGVVKLMNYAHAQLAAGISPEQHQAFRNTVTQGIQAVETFCKQRRGKPERVLPAPSYKAYLFLKSIDLNNLPAAKGNPPEAQKSLRFKGIVTRANRYHQEFKQMLPDWRQATTEAEKQQLMTPLTEKLHATVTQITAQCAESGALPSDLAKPSRRAFQWMALLSDPAFLAMHLDTLNTLHIAIQEHFARRARSQRRGMPDITLKLYNTSVAYNKKQNGEVLLNEGYITAPDAILKTLARIATGSSSQSDMNRCKAYTKEQAFQEIHSALELTTPVSTRAAKGRVYDLEEVFERVNLTYFDGEIARPNLVWSDTHTYRKMGHYNYTEDTVLISLSLDDAQVPKVYIDYVMYHELLHKQLGVRIVNGRRYAHTPEFRRREQQYPHWDQVQAYEKALRKQ